MNPLQIGSTALILNLVVSSGGVIGFARAGYLYPALTWPFILASIPMAWIGSTLKAPGPIYDAILSLFLWVAAARLTLSNSLTPRAQARELLRHRYSPPALPLAAAAGGGIGIVSGIVGVGGGVLLSPLMLLCRWAEPKRIAATSAVFIFVNSAAGLIGRWMSGRLAIDSVGGLIPAALLGGWVGAWLGARRLPRSWLNRILALILASAAIKLLIR